MLIEGRVSGLIALVVIFICLRAGLATALKRSINFRRIPGLDAVEEAVGRATEMGRPVLHTPGYMGISTSTLAGLDLLTHIGRLAARYDNRVLVTVGSPNTYAVASEVLQNAYLAEGKPEAYSQDMVHFTAEVQFAYTAATLGLIQREKPAAVFCLGDFLAESIILSEAAAAVGAITIAGTTAYGQIPYFVAACDYTMIGEEFLAAGAYMSGDPKRIGTIAGQDYVKMCIIVIMVLGLAMTTAGNDLFIELLTK